MNLLKLPEKFKEKKKKSYPISLTFVEIILVLIVCFLIGLVSLTLFIPIIK